MRSEGRVVTTEAMVMGLLWKNFSSPSTGKQMCKQDKCMVARNTRRWPFQVIFPFYNIGELIIAYSFKNSMAWWASLS